MYNRCALNKLNPLTVAPMFIQCHFAVGLNIQVNMHKEKWTEKATSAAEYITQSHTPPPSNTSALRLKYRQFVVMCLDHIELQRKEQMD